MNSLRSSRYFWELFRREQSGAPQDVQDTLEHKRHLCLLGFTALEGALCFWWESVVSPQWDETLCLVEAVLESEDALDGLTERAGGVLSNSQFGATLRFLRNAGEPGRFSPSLADMGCALMLLASRSRHEEYDFLAKELFRLQRLRNRAFHVGRGLSELEAHDSVKALKHVAEQCSHLHPALQAAFQSKDALAAA